jgi:predicted transposase YbfD/YdcC
MIKQMKLKDYHEKNINQHTEQDHGWVKLKALSSLFNKLNIARHDFIENDLGWVSNAQMQQTRYIMS